MSIRRISAALACALAVSPVYAGSSDAGRLRRALAIWSAADADRDGRIGAIEAASFPIDAEGFRRGDLDGDGAWSREEFLHFYRRCLIASSEPIGADLEAEIVRQRALKKVRALEEARRCDSDRRSCSFDSEIAAAFAGLEARLRERRASPDDVVRLRTLIRAKLAPPASGGSTMPPQRLRSIGSSAADGEALFDRLRSAAERREDAPADRASLRALLARRGWIAAAPAESRRR
jgi:hypothetical protein